MVKTKTIIVFVMILANLIAVNAGFKTSFDNNDSLLVYYAFDENSTAQGNVTDYSGNSHTGFFQSIAAIENRWSNLSNSLDINDTKGMWEFNTTAVGRANAINTSISPFNNRPYNFTIAFWINGSVANVTNIVFSDGAGGAGQDSNLLQLNTGAIIVNVRNASLDTPISFRYSGLWNKGWQHVAFVYNFSGIAGTASIYLNGTLVNQSSAANALIRNSTNNYFHFGQQYTNAVQKLFFDDIRIYDAALTAAQISNLSNETYMNGTIPIINTAPTITVIKPATGLSTSYPDRPINITYNITDDTNTTLNNVIKVNTSTNATIIGYVAGTNQTVNLNLSRGVWNVCVNSTDGSLTSEACLNHTVNNTAPFFEQNMTNVSLIRGQTFNRKINCTDNDGDILLFGNNHTNLFNITSDGNITHTSLSGQEGNHTVLVSCSDEQGFQLGNTTQIFEYQINSSALFTTITSPTNDFTDNQPLNVSYKWNSTNGATNANCTLYVNATGNKTAENITNDTIMSFKQTGAYDGIFLYNIHCSTGSQASNSSQQTFTFDNTTPIITTSIPNPNNSSNFSRFGFRLNISCDDNNLNGFEINITNGTTGTEVTLFNATNTTTTLTQLNFTNFVNTSDWAFKNYTLTAFCTDTHTANALPSDLKFNTENATDFSFGFKDSDKIFFNMVYVEGLKKEPIFSNKINITNTKNEYFKWGWHSNMSNTGKILLHVSGKNLQYLPNSSYYGHFINDKYYLDFEDFKKDWNMTKLLEFSLNDKTHYVFQITSLKSISKTTYYFDPIIGGLNNRTTILSFAIYNDTPLTLSVQPNVTSLEKNLSTIQNFNVTVTDDKGTDNITWKFNSSTLDVIINSGNTTVNYNFTQTGNLSVIVNDTVGQIVVHSWNVTVNNIAPTITSFTPLSLILTIQENLTQLFSVNVSSDDSFSVTWLKDGVTQIINQSYHWVVGLDEQGEYLIKVTINDAIGQFVNLSWFVTVADTYPRIPINLDLSPKQGVFEYTIPIICQNKQSKINTTFMIEGKVNSGIYNNLSINDTDGILNWDITSYAIGDNFSLRCSAFDGYNYTGTINNSAIKKGDVNQFYLATSGNAGFVANNPYLLQLVAEFKNDKGFRIKSAFADCNGDNSWEYYWDYTNVTAYIGDIVDTRQEFYCINGKGEFTHGIGVILEKTNLSNSWNYVGCSKILETETLCAKQRDYTFTLK